MNILAIIQARASSTRLPKKVLLPILDKPMLERQIDRVKLSEMIDYLIVATSVEISDKSIEKLCHSLDMPCYRGSLDDVLDRFYSAAKEYMPNHIVRITGDCPVIDHKVIDKVIDEHLKSGADYTSNTIVPTYPDGLDVEIMKFCVLKDAWQNANLASERQHVTPYIKQQQKHKKINVEHHEDLSRMRLTVDELLDYELIKFIYESLYPNNKQFCLEDIVTLLTNNLDKLRLNRNIIRDEGYLKSLNEDYIISR